MPCSPDYWPPLHPRVPRRRRTDRLAPHVERRARRTVVTFLAMLATSLASSVTGLAETPPEANWVDIWNGPGNHDDRGQLVAVDPTGSIYVAGTTYEGGEGGNLEDLVLRCYEPDGGMRWSRLYGDQGGEVAGELLVPEPGKVALAGYSWNGSGTEVTLLVYDDLGNLLWDQHFPLRDYPGFEHRPRMVQDPLGNLVLCANDGGDYLVLRYSPTGTLLWSRTWSGTLQGNLARDLAVDSDGSVYVTGTTGQLAVEGAYATVKFDSTGTMQWEQFEAGGFGSIFPFAAIEATPDGDVVIVGNPESTCGSFELRVWKCSGSTGEVLWLDAYPDDPCDVLRPEVVVQDGGGNTYILGGGRVANSADGLHTLKYGPNGGRLWQRTYAGPESTSGQASDLCLDAAGDVYVVGSIRESSQNWDLAGVKYLANGTEAWSVTWAGPTGHSEKANGVAVAPAGDVFVAGQTYDPNEQQNLVAIHFRPEDPAGLGPTSDTPELSLQSGENPCRGGAMLRYQLQEEGSVRISLLDPLGRRLGVLHEGKNRPGIHELEWSGTDSQDRRLPSGVYFVRLETEREGTTVARINLIR